MDHRPTPLVVFVMAVGIALAGWFVGNGFYRGRAADRFVTVKGVAERDATADIAFWPLRYVATDDDLGRAQASIRESQQRIIAFLGRHGVDRSEVEVQRLDVTDRLAESYRSGPIESRFIIEQTLMVRSHEPEKIKAASQAVGELVDEGVVLTSGYGGGPTYRFTRLSDLKPAMIAEATAKARLAAEQFAEDSGSTIGGIRRANQGVFVILARDRAPGIDEGDQIHKTVRVVSTVEYYLEG